MLAIIGAVVGAVVGGVAGGVSTAAQNAVNAGNRRSFREGIRRGDAQTNKQIYDILTGTEFNAARNFVLGTYGIQGSQGQDINGNQPISFGGHTFYNAPSGIAPSRTAATKARAFGAELNGLLEAQRELDTGFDLRGRRLSDADLEKARMRVQNGAELAANFDSLPGEIQQIVANKLGRRGFSTDALNQYRPQTQELAAAQAAPGGTVPGYGLDSPLARDFAKSIQANQAGRGLFRSNAAAAAEASGLAAFNFQQQANLLPQLLGLATFGDDTYERYRQANIATAVQKTTGGVGVFGAANPFGQQSVVAGIANGAVAGAGAGAGVEGALYGGGFNPTAYATPQNTLVANPNAQPYNPNRSYAGPALNPLNPAQFNAYQGGNPYGSYFGDPNAGLVLQNEPNWFAR